MNQKELNAIFESLLLTPSQLLESEIIEFKNYKDENSLNNDKDLSNEISALANFKGGIIIIGVIDNTRTDPQSLRLQLNGFRCRDLDTTAERLRGRVKPKIPLKIYEIRYDSKYYLVIEVPKTNWTLVTTTTAKVYVRDGKSSRPMEPQEIEASVKRLQTYDWSSEEIAEGDISLLNTDSLNEAVVDFCTRRKIETVISKDDFLESIGATKNGTLTKTGLLLLGREEPIKELLGDHEYRFCYKTKSGQLKINEIWCSNIWEAIKKIKYHYAECNKKISIDFEGKNYELPALDDKAFHEALLNAIVHRDYSVNGMISIVFSGTELKIINPGTFYGGVNEKNIAFHDPRHRNKELAKCLMLFNLVDRAGMGVLRMGIGSLIYGRKLPRFKEHEDFIEVSMDAEYLNASIFVITTKVLDQIGLTDLIVLNRAVENGYFAVSEIIKELSKVNQQPWERLVDSISTGEFSKYLEFVGDRDNVYVAIKRSYREYFSTKRNHVSPQNSHKYVALFMYLKSHGSANNSELVGILDLQNTSYLSKFLSETRFIEKKGNTKSTRWYLKENA